MGSKTRVENATRGSLNYPAPERGNENCCPRCHEDVKTRMRNFSAQALAALVAWGEMEPHIQQAAICDGCYGELREVLIEQAEELEGFEVRAGATVKNAG